MVVTDSPANTPRRQTLHVFPEYAEAQMQVRYPPVILVFLRLPASPLHLSLQPYHRSLSRRLPMPRRRREWSQWAGLGLGFLAQSVTRPTGPAAAALALQYCTRHAGPARAPRLSVSGGRMYLHKTCEPPSEVRLCSNNGASTRQGRRRWRPSILHEPVHLVPPAR